MDSKPWYNLVLLTFTKLWFVKEIHAGKCALDLAILNPWSLAWEWKCLTLHWFIFILLLYLALLWKLKLHGFYTSEVICQLHIPAALTSQYPLDSKVGEPLSIPVTGLGGVTLLHYPSPIHKHMHAYAHTHTFYNQNVLIFEYYVEIHVSGSHKLVLILIKTESMKWISWNMWY